MEKEINIQVENVIKSNRAALNGFASRVFAMDLFKPDSRLYDPDYQVKIDEAKSAGNKDLVLNRSPRRFSVRDLTISTVGVGTNVNDEVVLILNKGLSSEMEIPYTCEKEFGKTDEDIVKDAIKNPDKNLVFSDPSKLASLINKLNQGEIARIDKLIDSLNKAKKQCVSAIADVNDKVSRYLAQKAGSAKKVDDGINADLSNLD